jgi:hypothetical protein
MKKFKDHPNFTPSLTPRQIFKAGVFGGTYFRPIYSSVANKQYIDAWKEFPWLDPSLCSHKECNISLNKYKVKSGTSLVYWESKGWIHPQDPYGWIQWYCRFYNGRRTLDDERQIDRWIKIAGPNGRFFKRLQNLKVNGKDSPVIRQLLLQWGVEFF